MTAQPQQHCSTCDHCKIEESLSHTNKRPRCEITRWYLDMYDVQQMIAKIGCASHSSRPVAPAPCPQYKIWQYCPARDEIAAQAREDSKKTDNILAVLKKRYRDEPAIIDYVEMIECELNALREAQR